MTVVLTVRTKRSVRNMKTKNYIRDILGIEDVKEIRHTFFDCFDANKKED